MSRTIFKKNFFPTSISGSYVAPTRESVGFTNHKSPPPLHDQSNKKVRKRGIAKVVTENVVVIVALQGCFMCFSMYYLLEKLGVYPKFIEVEKAEKIAMLIKLSKIEGGEGGPWELPVVYVGGKLLGGVDKVMKAHIKGEFVPMLRAAGAFLS